jgi:hypothetical protein
MSLSRQNVNWPEVPTMPVTMAILDTGRVDSRKRSWCITKAAKVSRQVNENHILIH